MRSLAGIVLFSLFVVRSVFSQTPGIVLNQKYGGSGSDEFSGIAQLTNGNYVMGGNTYSTDFQATGNHGNNDFFITCIKNNGQLLWQKVLGGSAIDGDNFDTNKELVAATADGGFYFAGATYSNDGDISLNHGYADLFIARFDSAGNILWKKTFGGNGTEFLCGFRATPDGGCIALSTTGSDNNGDVPESYVNESSKSDVWLVKIDSSGSIQWSKTYGGTGTEQASDLELTSDGYIMSVNTSSADGDITGSLSTGVRGRAEIWIVNMDTSGTIRWKELLSGSDEDDNASICAGSDGNYYLSCSSRSADGDFAGNQGLYDIGAFKLAPDGTVLWKKDIGGISWDSNNDIIETADGNLEILGSSYSTSINGLHVDNRGGSGILLYKISKMTGNPLWAVTLGGTQGDFGMRMIKSNRNETVIVGGEGSTDYDFGYSGFGADDAFLLSLAPLNVIQGSVFYDLNSNGLKDANESFIENAQVISSKSNGYSVGSYTENGSYHNEVDSGTFITKVRLFKGAYFTVAPDSFITAFPSYYGAVFTNFGIRPIPGQQDLAVNIFPTSGARYGTSCSYYIVCYNTGTDTIQSGRVTLTKDARLPYASSSTPPSSVTRDTISWLFSNLKPFDTLTYQVTLNIPSGQQIRIGDKVVSHVVANPVATDVVPADNEAFLTQTITGSYDPNDKQESHGGTIKYSQLQKGEYLNYTIRFQNTGNDLAYKIVVLDTLQSGLTHSSFQMLAASHPYSLRILNDSILEWTFDNIQLPDSTTNEPASHGFVSFLVRGNPALTIGNTITNNAGIYFDYNLPVITNTATTVITPDAVLPVVFSGFAVAKKGSANELSWMSDLATGTGSFYIQHSTDGVAFTTLAGMPANTASHTYHYTDVSPSPAINYYRIVLAGSDGSTAYSVIRSVDNRTGIRISLYPNPVRDELILKGLGTGSSLIRISNASGKKVLTFQVTGDMYRANVKSLSPGVYYISVSQNNKMIFNSTVLKL